MPIRKPTLHSMNRRCAAHDYTNSGVYHVTLYVADGIGQPFGRVVGDIDKPDGHPDAPHVALTPVGQMVEQELLHSIRHHYPMIAVQDYVIMPEHIHCILVVQDKILSTNGYTQPLGRVIAGFKKGCNRRYWEITGQAEGGGGTAARTPGGQGAGMAAGGQGAGSVPGGLPAGYKVPSGGTTGRQPLFASGFCDVMPVDAAQLATQRAYIAGNPRSRMLRSSHREWLQTRRGGIDTAITLPALQGYLRRECAPSQCSPEALAAIQDRLLLADSRIACDSYGDRSLLQRHLLPVVCHRRDKARLAEQKARCLEAAAQGAVLVSPRIAKGEQEIIDDAVHAGFPVVIIHDNGFSDRYHPSQERIDLCAAGRQLLVSPWQYRYRGKEDGISVTECKAMNCVAQALCRTKDTWWKC